MKRVLCCLTLLSLLAVVLAARSAHAQAIPRDVATMTTASAVLDEIITAPLKAVPRSMLFDAHAVAIIPGVVKVGLVAGVRSGRGVLLVREADGWQPPTFISLTGGSLGWQAGVQSADVVLVFKTRKSVDGLLRGKFTLGADASIAAGPVGREASAATDLKLSAEVYSYSRSRGLFVGVALDGTVLQVDGAATQAFYQPAAGALPGRPAALPAPAARLIAQLTQYTAADAADGQAAAPPVLAGQPAAAPGDALRRELAVTSPQLYRLLDDQWRSYLALPSGVFGQGQAPTVETLGVSLQRFDTVAGTPAYQALTARPEFQQTHRLIQQYSAALRAANAPQLQLPPPPK